MLKNKKSAKKRKMNENIDSDIDEYDDTSKIDYWNGNLIINLRRKKKLPKTLFFYIKIAFKPFS